MENYIIVDTLKPEMVQEGLYVKDMPFMLLSELNMKGRVVSMLSKNAKKCIETALGKELRDVTSYTNEKVILVVTNKDFPSNGIIPSDMQIKFLLFEKMTAGVADVANKLLKKLL